MDQESLSIAHKYISLEWARRTVEYDLKRIQQAGLKYPSLFEGVAVKVLDHLLIQMRDLKQEMRKKDLKVVYMGRKRYTWGKGSIQVSITPID